MKLEELQSQLRSEIALAWQGRPEHLFTWAMTLPMDEVKLLRRSCRLDFLLALNGVAESQLRLLYVAARLHYRTSVLSAYDTAGQSDDSLALQQARASLFNVWKKLLAMTLRNGGTLLPTSIKSGEKKKAGH